MASPETQSEIAETVASLFPHGVLFRVRLPVRHVEGLPRDGAPLLDLPEACRLPDFSELEEGRRFGELRAAWNRKGVGFQVEVRGKTGPPVCDARDPTSSDGLQLWMATRTMEGVHRANRFCYYFCVLPGGAGEGGRQPVARHLPIPRARENPPPTVSSPIWVWSEIRPNGYTLEVWFDRELLYGFDPDEMAVGGQNPILGFYYLLKDCELGEQYLSVGRDLPFASHPSLWSTLELLPD